MEPARAKHSKYCCGNRSPTSCVAVSQALCLAQHNHCTEHNHRTEHNHCTEQNRPENTDADENLAEGWVGSRGLGHLGRA